MTDQQRSERWNWTLAQWQADYERWKASPDHRAWVDMRLEELQREADWMRAQVHRLGDVRELIDKIERLDALVHVLLDEINEVRAFRGQEPLSEDQRPF